MTSPLFRPEAVRAQRTEAFGETILVQPVSHLVLIVLAALTGSALAAFLISGTYTRHTTLIGQLTPTFGVVKLHTPQLGTISEKRVREGDLVSAGEVLYVISGERFSSAFGATQDLVRRQLEVQEESLRTQIDSLRLLAQTNADSIAQSISALSSETRSLLAIIDAQREKVALAEETALRYERMRGEGFVSDEQSIAKKEALLEQRAQLERLEREQSSSRRQLAELQNQATNLPLEYENRVAELARAIANVRREASQNEAQRTILITAPTSGTATAVTGEVGQFVDGSRPLLSIVPVGSMLEAHLYAPSRAVGFIDVGDTVLLRYQAFPYQKFGHHEGIVESVSRVALSAAEFSGGSASHGDASGEPVYRVTVRLESQTINAYGTAQPLQAGMMLEADALQETRRLYEWVLEPLYTLTGKVRT